MADLEDSIEDSSQSGGCDDGSSFTHDNSEKAVKDKEEKLARTETRAVFRLRLMVILALLLASAALSGMVYYITKNGQHEEYISQYTGASSKIQDKFYGILTEKVGAIGALAVATIAHGVDHRRDWPFVTLSSFQERCANARVQSKAIFVELCPMVGEQDFRGWLDYSTQDEDDWIADAISYQRNGEKTSFFDGVLPENASEVNPGFIHYVDENGDRVRDIGPGPFMPVWETSPLIKSRQVNSNILRDPGTREDALRCFQTASAVIGNAVDASGKHAARTRQFLSDMRSYETGTTTTYRGDPVSQFFLPVFDSFSAGRKPVAVVIAYVAWMNYFHNILPSSTAELTIVIENSCHGAFTFAIKGATVEFVGPGDHHENKYDSEMRIAKLNDITSIDDGTEFGLPINFGNCTWSLSTYPSTEFYRSHNTTMPILMTCGVAAIFLFTAAMFSVYDRLVARRQQIIMRRAIKSSAIVASLFPPKVREQMMAETDEAEGPNQEYMAPQHRLKSYLGGAIEERPGQKPIAEVFPDATVMFCDIAGFTAWSSTRDPTSVFVLLQSVYRSFDEIAKNRKVFKVETIGDSYLAVTGVPEPQPRHAIIMAKFASDCMTSMDRVTKDLETELGPGTTDLAMRFGIHSGNVIAGVLRGERSRFQLFGDTVNTAARMESTGKRNMIQCSEATAKLLAQQGKGHWVTPREDLVNAKGKGVLKTHWIRPISRGSASSFDETRVSETERGDLNREVGQIYSIDRHQRLIDWVVEMMKPYLKRIIARRKAVGQNMGSAPVTNRFLGMHGSALEEVREAIYLPDFDPAVMTRQEEIAANLELDDRICSQLRKFVTRIAARYRMNAFHNFEHACHVTLSVHKFLQRIAKPNFDEKLGTTKAASQIHHYTEGLTSDPLALFAIVLSALVHDVDHRGVSNIQLAKEDTEMALLFEHKSIAEQHSFALSWELLMSPKFDHLRNSIVGTSNELKRLRQILVNVVLATDIMDKEMNQLRNARWQKAFSTEKSGSGKQQRATIFIEHIIQASDVSHTMQHWHIYQKWNTALFNEMSEAYRLRRMDVDPASFWYEGELKFFDNYIIPLAKKLKECNVFGVSSDECFNYATRNRAEWEEKGKSIVESLVLARNEGAVPVDVSPYEAFC